MKKITPKLVIIVIVSVLILAGIGFAVLKVFTAPLPGQAVADLGRSHVPIGTQENYNSNPPTSGPHYEDWVRFGVYDGPKDDRNLVHSLEHGYIVISYNCDFGKNDGQRVPNLGPIELATDSAHLSANFKSDECKALVTQLTKIYNDENYTKIVVIPRPNLDAKLALTTWARIDKWNPNFPLSTQDISRIKNFIEVLRDHGPEKTME
jgi:hypothetical protein